MSKMKGIKTDRKQSKWRLEDQFSAQDEMVKNMHTKSGRNWGRESDPIRNTKHCVHNECVLGGRGIRKRIQNAQIYKVLVRTSVQLH